MKQQELGRAVQQAETQRTGRFCALYMRLSFDNGNVGDSDSIVHQRQMLYKYARAYCRFENIRDCAENTSKPQTTHQNG